MRHHQNQLLDLLDQCYAVQRKYGEAADAIPDRERAFQLALGEYSIGQVQAAFVHYLKNSSVIPTPADIVGIIDPSTKSLCARVYQTFINHSKGGPLSLTECEKDYIHEYEQQELSKTV